MPTTTAAEMAAVEEVGGIVEKHADVWWEIRILDFLPDGHEAK
jgi:hypothetical protein